MQWVQTLKGEGAEVPKLVEKGKGKFTGPELKGKKLGVIGLGAIGVQVCNTALHFGMEIYGYDPFLSVAAAWKMNRDIKHAKTLKEIYENCDYISLHLPLTPETKGMINSQTISSMKSHVRILNFSRGELVDDADMLEALEEKQVYCYVTDFPNDTLLGHPGVVALPHLGASTPESEDNCAEMAANQLDDYLSNGNIVNAVNMPSVVAERTGKFRLTVVHKNQSGMIAKITAIVGESQNISNMANSSKGDYAYTLLDLDGRVSDATVDNLKAIDGVIRVRVIK
jgi:D-3-phosphoglycerate dehydrogenase